MTKRIHEELQGIERSYYDGARFEALSEQIIRVAEDIRQLAKDHPLRIACEELAPILWGGDAATDIDPGSLRATLKGPGGESYLRAWSTVGRVLLAKQSAAA